MSSPDYYNPKTIEAIDVIEAWNLNFNLGNAIKYIARAGGKEGQGRSKDLGKAVSYLYREIHGKWPWEETPETSKKSPELGGYEFSAPEKLPENGQCFSATCCYPNQDSGEE